MSGKNERETESRRIIDRVGAEAEASMAQRVRNHLAGRDADQKDWVEVWGTRIGRVLGLMLFVYLLYVLAGYIAAS